MRTDGVFRTKLVRIKNWTVGKPIQLIPFGDIHHDSPAHAEEEFAEFCAYARKQKNVLFLGMGDYNDGYSTSERAIIYDRKIHESTKKTQEKEAIGRLARLAKQIEFMRGKLIGLMGGNHYCEFANGTTSDQRLAEMLGTTYLGSCAAIRISISRPGTSSGSSIDIFAHHGRGGGTTAGGKLNAVEKLANVCDADIYLMGDNHARGCIPAGDRMYLTHGPENRMLVKTKKRWIGRTGSFLKGYVENEASYVVDAALPPCSLGWIEFTLTLRRDQTEGKEEDSIQIGAKQ
jgi:hypothetical protein